MNGMNYQVKIKTLVIIWKDVARDVNDPAKVKRSFTVAFSKIVRFTTLQLKCSSFYCRIFFT